MCRGREKIPHNGVTIHEGLCLRILESQSAILEVVIESPNHELGAGVLRVAERTHEECDCGSQSVDLVVEGEGADWGTLGWVCKRSSEGLGQMEWGEWPAVQVVEEKVLVGTPSMETTRGGVARGYANDRWLGMLGQAFESSQYCENTLLEEVKASCCCGCRGGRPSSLDVSRRGEAIVQEE